MDKLKLFEHSMLQVKKIYQRYHLLDRIGDLNEDVFQPNGNEDIFKFDFQHQDDGSYFELRTLVDVDINGSGGINDLKIEICKKHPSVPDDYKCTEYCVSIEYKYGGYRLRHRILRQKSIIIDSLNQYKEGLESIINYMNRREKILSAIVMQNDGTRPSILENLLHGFDLDVSYLISAKYVSSSISIDEFIKLDTDDINYNNTIYRIIDDDLVDALTTDLLARRLLGKAHRVNTVKRNKLFYIENLDIQDVSECGYDTIDRLVNAGYKVVNITH